MCTYIYVNKYIYVCIYIYGYIRLYVYICTCVHICIEKQMHDISISIYVHTLRYVVHYIDE